MKGTLARLRLYFPMRFKFMLAQLLVVTSAVGVITFTMARLFHTDKTAYLHDLASVIALHSAEQTHSLLSSYQEKLQVFARMMTQEGIPAGRKSEMLRKLFRDFPEFIMVSEYEGESERATVYDAKALEAAGLSKEALVSYQRSHPLPLERIRKGLVFVSNSTISDRLPAVTFAVAGPAAAGGEPKVVAAVVRLEGLIKLAGHSQVFETFITDSSGSLLGHADRRKVASRLKPGSTVEYGQHGIQMVGGFADVGFGGVLTSVQIPMAAGYLPAKSLLESLLWVALLLLVASAMLSFFWSRRLTRPIEKLSEAAREMGHGNFDIRVEPESQDEIGDLANSFNLMARELKAREKAWQLSQEQLVHSEKMSAFGQLGAGITHEVKTPLAGILGYAQLSLRKLEEGSPLHNNLKIIEKEAKRCKLITDNLMKFASQGKVAHELLDANFVVADAAAILDHHLGIHRIKLELELAALLPAVVGNGNQLEQVLINLMINAQQAMGGSSGTISLRTLLSDDGRVEIRIKDSGPGISKEIQARIFEPFFTTKSAGQGTGLGLSVSYGIIKDHKGFIRLQSEPGQGTEFIISLPVAPVDHQQAQLGGA